MNKLEYPKVTLGDIVKAYWSGMGRWRFLFIFAFIVGILGNVVNIITPIFYKRFFDVLSASGHDAAPVLLSILLSVLGLNILGWTLRRARDYGVNRVETGTMARLRQQAFDYLMEHSLSFFTNNFAGSMVARVGRFASSFENVADAIFDNLIALVVTAFGSAIVTWYISPYLSLLIIGWIVIFVSISYFYSKWRFRYNLKVSELDSRVTGVLADSIGNQGTVTLFAGLAEERGRYHDVTNEQRRMQQFVWDLGNIMDAVQLFMLALVEFGVFYVTLGFWEAGTATVGTFVLMQTYVIAIAQQQFSFGRVVRTFFNAQAQATEMLEIMKLPHEIQNVPGAKPLMVTEGAIEFEDVGFNFNETRAVFQHFSLAIPARQKVGLVGPSGAGKTTLVRLILRLYDVTSGRITIDGQDIHAVTQDSLHRRIGFVPQEPILFHRTLLDNIRYGKPGASEAEVIEAAKKAHCHEFIEQLPDKYGTFVGERGVKLSGGERQRVAIARAILKDAPILILDEATSSLDSESEALIQDALKTLMEGKTVIVIAHRLSTIRTMDRIVVIEGGAIREDGAHDDLLKNPDSLYKKLWNLQAGGFIPEEDES